MHAQPRPAYADATAGPPLPTTECGVCLCVAPVGRECNKCQTRQNAKAFCLVIH